MGDDDIKAAQPREKVFDPWNSASTGHQRAEGRPATGWSAIRHIKTNSQFKDGGRGGMRLVHPTEEMAEEPQGKSVMDMLRRPGSMGKNSTQDSNCPTSGSQSAEEAGAGTGTGREKKRKLFDGVNVYINGSTYPLISDHKLKMILGENGATMSLGLARRKVTHVILGKGLSGSKIQKETRRIGGCGLHYVGVEWYVFLPCFLFCASLGLKCGDEWVEDVLLTEQGS